MEIRIAKGVCGRHRSWAPRERYLLRSGGARPRAITIAARTGMPLKIAAKVDRVDQGYWEEKIRPMVQSHSNVEFIGEIGESDKVDFLSEAAALLFPGDWPEPFGLVMIEAMACGMPVIAFRHGSVPEVVQDGVSGFIVDTVEEAETAVQQLASLDRAKVRADFERRFTVERMAGDYLEIYRELAAVRATSTQVHRLSGKEVPLPTAASLAVATKASRPVLAHPLKSDPRMARGNVTARPVTPMKHDRSAMPG
jgi:hypothetical protein